MTLPATTDTMIECPLCNQHFRRVTCNGRVSFYDADAEDDAGSRCPFGDRPRRTNPTSKAIAASRAPSSPDGCFRDLLVKIFELHQLERRSYDGGLLALTDDPSTTAPCMCTKATPQTISASRQAFVTISARLARFMGNRDDPEHMCPACGHACCDPTRGGCGLCADCVTSGLRG